MTRSIRMLVLGLTVAAMLVPQFSIADPAPVYVCGGVAPTTYQCTSGPHEQIASFVNHGSMVVSPSYVGRLKSTINWTKGAASGSRVFYCDFKNPEDYQAQGGAPLGAPNCKGTGAFPPDCIDTTPECTVKYTQVCRSSDYKLDTGKGNGPWECDNQGV